MSTVKLPVNNGGYTLVDDDIAKKLECNKLYLSFRKRYVQAKLKSENILLHRFIMGKPKGMDVDHINGNRFDNRRCNLRICTRSENNLNRRINVSNSTGYRLVYTITKRNLFRMRYRVHGQEVHLCTFRSRHVGAIFADQILVKIVGPFVKKNFTEKITAVELVDVLKSTSGRIFRVVFSRRSDGRQREMVCRTGVNSKHSGGTITFDASSMNLFSVYDVQKRAYRFIPLENVICIRFAKTNYRVVA